MVTLIISILTIIFLILAIVFKPSIKIKKVELQTFWMIPLIGIIFLYLTKEINFEETKNVLFAESSINPIKILVLFLSVSLLSIVLDEVGFFKKCALIATKATKGSQHKLFLSLSIVVSVLTMFTSNDIVILTFTPFICYFAKHTKINPIPYLIAEFIFANTWSMIFIIGNPTNIYIAESFHIDFFEYFKIMAIPTIITGVSAYLILLLIFNRDLKKELDDSFCETKNPIKNKFIAIVGLIHLALCTIILAISSYIKLEMWYISLGFAGSLVLFLMIYYIIRKEDVIFKVIKRIPWNLIPFVLSMFIIVSALVKSGFIKSISELLDANLNSGNGAIFEYGIVAFLACNILNNIPMSVMFERIIANSNQLYISEEIYSTIIASNIGAYLSPIGALAGIMWMSILNKNDLKFSFKKFMKYGVMLAPALIVIALCMLSIII